MRTIVLDSGAFLAAERHDRKLIAFLQAADEENVRILVPATVLAEVWRDPPRHNSRTLVRASDAVVPLDEDAARAVGRLLDLSGTNQLTDAHVVITAITEGPSLILTSDQRDIVVLLRSAGASYGIGSTRARDVIVQAI